MADEITASYVNLTRPELSLCLLANLPPAAGSTAASDRARFPGTDDPKHREALAILEAAGG